MCGGLVFSILVEERVSTIILERERKCFRMNNGAD